MSLPVVELAETARGTGTLASNLKQFFNNSTFTDLTIQTTEENFKVHKLVLCAQSEYFAAMCNGHWKEMTECVISLKEDNPSVIKAMVLFMYGDDYLYLPLSLDGPDEIYFHMHVYQIADKYIMPALKDLAAEKFKGAICGYDKLPEILPEIISMAYTFTPRDDKGLRAIVLEICHKEIATLIQEDSFNRAMRDVDDFLHDLMLPLIKVNSKVNSYKCPSCQRILYLDKLLSRHNKKIPCLKCGRNVSAHDRVS